MLAPIYLMEAESASFGYKLLAGQGSLHCNIAEGRLRRMPRKLRYSERAP